MTQRSVPHGIGLYLAAIQLLFTLGWTVYAIYLPRLAAAAGIAPSAVILILLLDQAIFTASDFAMGVAADKIAGVVGRLGHVVAGVTLVSCAAFLAVPFVADLGTAAQPVFLVLILLWAVTSSALRAPPIKLIGKYAARPLIPWLASLTLLGYGVAGALAPYLAVALRKLDPRWPFALSAVTLLLAVLGLAAAERALARQAPARIAAPRVLAPNFRSRVLVFAVATLVLALGYQLHAFVGSAPLYLRFAKPTDLELLLPVFWIGFNIAMLPASLLTKRFGGLAVMGAGGLAGALAFLAADMANGLGLLIAAQFAAGCAWGVVLMSAVAAAVAIGQTGAEGAVTGLMFSGLALATLARMAAVAGGFASGPAYAQALQLAPLASWALAGIALVYLYFGTAKAGKSR